MKITVLSIMLLYLSACSTQRIQLAGSEHANAAYEGRHNFYLGGLGQSKSIKIKDVCGPEQKIEAFETFHTVGDAIFTYLTLGLYAPRSYAVYCSR